MAAVEDNGTNSYLTRRRWNPFRKKKDGTKISNILNFYTPRNLTFPSIYGNGITYSFSQAPGDRALYMHACTFTVRSSQSMARDSTREL